MQVGAWASPLPCREILMPNGDLTRICPGNIVTAYCSALPGYWDDGTDRRVWDVVGGCYDHKTGVAWIEDSCVGAKSVYHEEAHRQGVKDPKEAGLDWETAPLIQGSR